jgi:hypothetical protein
VAWTQTDIEALEAAIASGVLSVNYAGPPQRSITYQSTDAMLKALAIMRRQVNSGAGATTFRRVQWSKGFR